MGGIKCNLNRRFRRYRALGLQSIRQRKFVVLLLLVVILMAGSTYYVDARSDSNLVEVYKELDKKDFALQRMEVDKDEIADSVAEIYCGSQLDKARDYFAKLEERGLALKVDAIKYGEIEVLKHSWHSAVLLVESSYSGAFVKEGKTEETARELAVNTLCQVELAKTSGDWKVADVIVFKEK